VRLWAYLLRRLLLLIPVVIGVMTVTFLLNSSLPIATQLTAIYGAPGPRNPDIYQPTAPCPPPHQFQECYNPVYHRYLNLSGLDQPIPVQWVHYIGRILLGHWGYVDNASTIASLFPETAGQPVTTVLGWFLPYTLELVALAMGIVVAVAFPLGRLAAARRNRPVDQGVRALSFAGFAVPTYLLGSLLLMLCVLAIGSRTGYFAAYPWCPRGEPTWAEFTGSWPDQLCFAGNQYPSWLSFGVISHPTGFPTVDALLNGDPWLGADSLLRIVLPALVIAVAHLGLILRYVRNSSLEVMNLDYVRSARSQGISEAAILRRHVARNSNTMAITVLAVSFATFFGWLPVAEFIFNANGVGLMITLAAGGGGGGVDFAMVTGATLTLTFMVVIANVIADLLIAYFDPRVRLGETLSF
jgi:ABC-type dipeptide/oligopeptide/nickel transport system permease component